MRERETEKGRKGEREEVLREIEVFKVQEAAFVQGNLQTCLWEDDRMTGRLEGQNQWHVIQGMWVNRPDSPFNADWVSSVLQNCCPLLQERRESSGRIWARAM